MPVIKAAKAWGMPPTAFLFRKRHPSKHWTEWDYSLSEAVEQLEAERCPQCGLPVYVCHSDDPHIRFRVEEDICEASAERERYEDRQQSKSKDYKPAPGSTTRAIPYTTDGSDFTAYRDDYYEAEMRRRMEIAESHQES